MAKGLLFWLALQWQVVAPGGLTGCAFGTPFEFWVAPGSSDSVLVHLQGGGACWTLDTCDPRRAIAFDHEITAADRAQRVDGIFDRGNAANPFRHHTMVFVPYCTGDFHMGTRRVDYPAPAGDTLGGVSVAHTGFHNIRAVLEYIERALPDPSQIVVSGASAGGLASPFVAAEVAAMYPRSAVLQIADGVAGIRVPQSRALLRHWAVDSLLAAHGMPLPAQGDPFVAMYASAARRAPHVRFSQVSSRDDVVVRTWLARFGVDADRHPALIAQTYAEIDDARVCFRGRVVPSATHTVLWRSDFFSLMTEGQTLAHGIAQDLATPCTTPARDDDDAFLFAYRIKSGMLQEFIAGYARHLEWHAQHQDSLPWLAWFITDGSDSGVFIDGTFGISAAAFDARVQPAADAEDGARNITPYADLIERAHYRLRRDLSSDDALERGAAAALQKVIHVRVQPGREAAFEAAVRNAQHGRFSLYERISGGNLPGYLLVVQLTGWKDSGGDDDPTRAILRAAGDAVQDVRAEVWGYRPDLTYLPGR